MVRFFWGETIVSSQVRRKGESRPQSGPYPVPYPGDGDSTGLPVYYVWWQQDLIDEVQDPIDRLMVAAHHPCEVVDVNTALGVGRGAEWR